MFLADHEGRERREKRRRWKSAAKCWRGRYTNKRTLGFKKGSIYSFKSGNFENLKFVADSFTDFCDRLFTEEQEEEYYDSIEKVYVHHTKSRATRKIINN